MPKRLPWGRKDSAFKRLASECTTKRIPDIQDPKPRGGKVVSLDSQWGGTSKGYSLSCIKRFPVGARSA